MNKKFELENKIKWRNKFAKQTTNKSEHVGLTSLEDYKSKKKQNDTNQIKRKIHDESKLSFQIDEEEQVIPKKKKGLGKDPSVDTSFLPDKEREEKESIERDKLKEEWIKQQDIIKKQEIDIMYNYWDGTGLRRNLRIQKGESISQFLTKVITEVEELHKRTSESLMFVKDDYIIPSV